MARFTKTLPVAQSMLAAAEGATSSGRVPETLDPLELSREWDFVNCEDAIVEKTFSSEVNAAAGKTSNGNWLHADA